MIAVPGSVGNPDEANAAVDATIRRFGRLDYLVNNAGTSETAAPIPPQDLDRLGEDFWRGCSPSTWSGRSAVPAPRHRT